jgi:hypothetical protein
VIGNLSGYLARPFQFFSKSFDYFGHVVSISASVLT